MSEDMYGHLPALEARHTALELGEEAWISEDGPRDNPRLHWAQYQEDE